MIRLVFPQAHRRGGVERIVWEHARWFALQGPVEFVGWSFEKSETIHGLSIVRPSSGLSRKPARIARALTETTRKLSSAPEISFGVVCPPAPIVNVNSVHRRWVMSGTSVPVGPFTVPAVARRAMPRHRAILRREREYFADPTIRCFVAVSTNVADDLREFYDIGDDRIRIIPNGYAEDEFNLERRHALREQTRAAMQRRDDEIAILFVANELHRKGFGELVDALGRLADERMHLHVVGSAPPDPYRAAIERAGMTDRVHYDGISNDVAAYMAASDLFVLPTHYEAFGLVIIEALATGLPVITSRAAGASHAIRPGTNGLLLDDPTDVDELAAAIARACEPDHLAALQLESGHSVADFRWNAVLPRVAELVATERS